MKPDVSAAYGRGTALARRGRQTAPSVAARADAAGELVTVIVPAYNAAATLDETLRSVRGQTHDALEILVVDDGSTDASAEIAHAHARLDPRVRVLRQDNAGVAAARNRGLDEARARWVAPVDADDLWAPTKIERQLARATEGVTLVYTWSAIIDESGAVVSLRSRPEEEGRVFARMCRGNMLGNGSSALMRKSDVLAVGGYDPELRAQGAQGCEDLKLYLALAETGRFAGVQAFLTGYRVSRSNMSSDALQMLRSYELAMAPFRDRHPELEDDFYVGDVEHLRWLLIRSLRARRWTIARKLSERLFQLDTLTGVRSMGRMPLHFTRLGVSALRARLRPPPAFLPPAPPPTAP